MKRVTMQKMELFGLVSRLIDADEILPWCFPSHGRPFRSEFCASAAQSTWHFGQDWMHQKRRNTTVYRVIPQMNLESTLSASTITTKVAPWHGSTLQLGGMLCYCWLGRYLHFRTGMPSKHSTSPESSLFFSIPTLCLWCFGWPHSC